MATQVSEMPSQAFEVQSVSTLHFRPLPQAVQTPPPQSTSVSAPSFWWSAHWLPTQRCARPSHAFEVQSVSPRHFLLSAHVGQVPPPQSTSVSLPSCCASVHWLVAHLPVTLSHALSTQSPLTRHPLPTAQGEQVPPPQSMSVSLPSFCPSLHWLASHTCAVASHAVVVQSLSMRHFLPSAQAAQTLPPQSVSVSLPSSWPSLHWLEVHSIVVPSQAPEVQSPPTLHFLPTTHPGQVPPPQSTSVSLPSSWWSSHWLAMQTSVLASQAVDVQSLSILHFLATAQVGQVPPPQSVSVSLPFCTLSEQSGVHVPPAHCAPAQSLPVMHILLGAHFGQVPPPQSTSVSLAFWTPSMQVGAAQVPVVQTLSMQSEPTEHFLPSAQRSQGMVPPPPQSTSVSWPSSTPSVQPSDTHRCCGVQASPVGQSVFWRHATQVLIPSHTILVMHGVPMATIAVPGVPIASQVPVRQGFIGTGTFFVSSTGTMLPLPSHWVPWQSFVEFGSRLAPTGRNCVPHTPLAHVFSMHAVVGGGQSLGAMHWGPVAPPPVPSKVPTISVQLEARTASARKLSHFAGRLARPAISLRCAFIRSSPLRRAHRHPGLASP